MELSVDRPNAALMCLYISLSNGLFFNEVPFAQKDVLKIRHSWVVLCCERQNYFSHSLSLLKCRLSFTEFDFKRYSLY